MEIKIHQSAESTEIQEPVYFQTDYLSTQKHKDFVIYESDEFLIPFNLNNRRAISIEKSPFGSFLEKFPSNNESLVHIDAFLRKDLKKRGVKEMEIRHPSPIYSSFAASEKISSLGYSTIHTDINQHIQLGNNWEDSIHQMQQRKLSSLRSDGFEFRVMDLKELEVAYKFLSVCRQTQGLEINISWEKLLSLVSALPEAYEIFGVFRENRISALCIAVNVTKEVAYYYLPATSPMFRSQSPMVLLIEGMVDHYYKKGFKILDLGVSSIQGRPQETLRTFKERMGAIETTKPTFTKLI